MKLQLDGLWRTLYAFSVSTVPHLLAIFVIALPSLAEAEFTYQDLENILYEGDGVKSVEALIPKLPEEMRKNVTFALKSHSNVQEGPRAILFSTTGRMTLTFNGDPKLKGGNSVEVMEVTESGDQVLHDIKFSPDRSKLAEKGGTESCMACHGSSPRKIFNQYPFWEDMCGGDDDMADSNCLNFLKSARSNSRFEHLAWPETNGNSWPYYSDLEYNRILTNMPNTRYSYISILNNARSMANQISKSPVFEKLKYSYLNQGYCLDEYDFGKRENLERKIREALDHIAEIPVPSYWYSGRASYLDQADLLEVMGLPYGDTSTNFEYSKSGMGGIAFGEIDFSHTGSSYRYLMMDVIRIVATQDPEYQKYIDQAQLNYEMFIYSEEGELKSFYEGVPGQFGELLERYTLDNAAMLSSCEHIIKKSEAELEALKNLPKFQEDFEAPHTLELGQKIVSTQCTGCHQPANGPQVGPPISFANAAQLKNDILFYDSIAIPLAKQVEDLLRSGAMPMNHIKLEDHQIDAVLKYLNSL